MSDCVILVSGTRGFNDAPLFNKELWSYIKTCARLRGLRKKEDVLIIFGCAKTGADKLAWDFCKDCKIPYKRFIADWTKYGLGAGHIRNQEMVDYKPTNALFVWDGQSKGTKDCMNRINKLNVPNTTLYFDPPPNIEEISATLFKFLRKYSGDYTTKQIKSSPKLRRSINRKAISDLKDVYDGITNKQISDATTLLSENDHV